MPDWDALVVVEYTVRVTADTYTEAMQAAVAADPLREGEKTCGPDVLALSRVGGT